MKIFFAVVFAVLSYSNGVFGMDCNFGTSKNVLDKLIHTCPRPIVDSPNEEYCCIKNNDVTCCDVYEFIGTSIIFFLPYIIAFLVISCIISCICCLCCRRSGGRVYGTVPPSTLAQRIVIVPAGSTNQQRNTVYPPEVYPASAPLIYTAQ